MEGRARVQHANLLLLREVNILLYPSLGFLYGCCPPGVYAIMYDSGHEPAQKCYPVKLCLTRAPAPAGVIAQQRRFDRTGPDGLQDVRR